MSCFSNKVGGVLWQTATCAPFFSLRKFWPLAPIFWENILSTRYGHCSSDMTWIIRMLSLPEEKILPILVVFYYTVFTFLAPSCIPPYPSSACKEEEMFIHVPARNGYCSVKLLSLSPIVRRGSHIHNIAELTVGYPDAQNLLQWVFSDWPWEKASLVIWDAQVVLILASRQNCRRELAWGLCYICQLHVNNLAVLGETRSTRSLSRTTEVSKEMASSHFTFTHTILEVLCGKNRNHIANLVFLGGKFAPS